MSDIYKKIGKRIAELRKFRGLTQFQLAEKMGVEEITISRFETGTRFPQKENLIKLAEILAVELKDIFDFEHSISEEELLHEISQLLIKANLKDLKYIYRTLRLYFESK